MQWTLVLGTPKLARHLKVASPVAHAMEMYVRRYTLCAEIGTRTCGHHAAVVEQCPSLWTAMWNARKEGSYGTPERDGRMAQSKLFQRLPCHEAEGL